MFVAFLATISLATPVASRAALDTLAATNRPYYRITESGEVTILGARLVGASDPTDQVRGRPQLRQALRRWLVGLVFQVGLV